jgi:hypothetical protein
MTTLSVILDKKHDLRYKAAFYPDSPNGGASTPNFFSGENALRQFLGNRVTGRDSTERLEILLAELKDKGQASMLLE